MKMVEGLCGRLEDAFIGYCDRASTVADVVNDMHDTYLALGEDRAGTVMAVGTMALGYAFMVYYVAKDYLGRHGTR
ncbi:TPA: hypothetical protein HA265_00425 [Candidatus Woesearchaeota archaeon]|nr:hypothetical protein [Candidatus Woesearchaeota archaeon]